MKPHQGGECHECAGDGTYGPDDGSPDKSCETCGGSGLANWSWQVDDVGHCDFCDATDDRPVNEWDDSGENGQCTWVCEPCAKQLHADHCGCDAEEWEALAGQKGAP